MTHALRALALACSMALVSPAHAQRAPGFSVGEGRAARPAALAAAACVRKEPFLIAPMLGEIGRRELDGHGNVLTLTHAEGDRTTADGVRELLDALEPGGPRGHVVLGYTLPVPLLSLFSKDAKGAWVIDAKKLGFYTGLIRSVRRPVVVTTQANHFSPESPLVRELMADPVNLMTYAGGPVAQGRYFSTTVVPFTLSTSMDVPVNRLRFQALEALLKDLQAINRASPGRVRAVTLFGESHQLMADLKGGVGNFAEKRFTDYSPLARREFVEWLRARYPSIEAFNQAAGTRFADWAAVRPPERDIRTDKLGAFHEHIDAYASGRLPVFGWLDERLPSPVIGVYLNGRRVGQATTGLSRLDVFEAVPEARQPNIGFRYELDYSALPAGRHRVDVVAESTPGGAALIDSRELLVFARNQAEPRDDWRQPLANAPARKLDEAGLRGWLDSPRNQQDLYFNPLARLWQQFREHQVERFVRVSWERATRMGFARERLYSHQIAPELNGSWNDMLFAAAGTNRADSPYQIGMTAYGGIALSPEVRRRAGDRRYGLPEFNPLMGKDASLPLQALRLQRAQCADFVSPYYMDIEWLLPTLALDGHEAMRIEPRNPRKGGAAFYSAIQQLVRE